MSAEHGAVLSQADHELADTARNALVCMCLVEARCEVSLQQSRDSTCDLTGVGVEPPKPHGTSERVETTCLKVSGYIRTERVYDEQLGVQVCL